MPENGGMAFARLLSQRRGELDLSVVDIAVRTGRPIEVVVGWDQGRAVPNADDLANVAETLNLPKPLLKEALRRVTESRLGTPMDPVPDGPASPDDEPAPTLVSGDGVTAATHSPATYSERARQLSALALSSMSGMVADMRQSMSRRRRLARAPIAHPSYMEDREQLITYRLRIVFTAAGLAALALILRWSLEGLGSAIADLWDALIGAL